MRELGVQSEKVLKTQLAKGVTIADYEAILKREEKSSIIALLRSRFEERYLGIMDSKNCHGFTIMAISCLMIEALESFHEGLASTKGISEIVFRRFFDHAEGFAELRPYVRSFYENVRCGILHQAETTGGWLIRKSGNLFDKNSSTINAAEFLKRLREHFEKYLTELTNSEWNSTPWIRLKNKFAAIIENCEK